MKAALIQRLFRGYPDSDLRAQGEAFAAVLYNKVRQSMTEQLAWHRAQGHRLVMVSASLEVYLWPLGHRLGFDATLATGLEVGENGCLSGRLNGANVRRAEKVARLSNWLTGQLDGGPYELWAYGDSAGDKELLAMAHHPRRV
jgi:HAD superfamily hydrolase (TIGR01490 family)